MPKCPKDCHKPNPLIFRRVIIPSALGDDKENPPENGAYCNALVIYEANNAMYLYSSDGIPTKIPTSITSYNDLTHKPSINGVELEGDISLEELGISDLIEESVASEATARAEADEALQDAIDAEEAARIAADRDIIDSIPTVNDATLTIQRNGTSIGTFTANSASDTTINVDVPIYTSGLINDSGYVTEAALSGYATDQDIEDAVSAEASIRADADRDLQSQIDAISSASDVVDVVGTYAELQNYDTSKLSDNDIIKVLADSTHDNAISYYRWDDANDTFVYIGSQGPFYTKSETDATFVPQTRTVNGKALSTDIVLTASDVSALPASTVIPTVNNATLTIKRNGNNVASFTANSASDVSADIAVPTKTSDITNDSNFVSDANYVHTDNNFTTTLKNKLDGIAAGAEVNVQSDWNQTNSSADDYIKNKPSIPTKTSDLTNDSGYISTLPIAGANTLGAIKVGTNLSIAADGTLSADAQSITVDSALSSTSTNPVENRVINTALGAKANTADLADVATSGDYDDLLNKPTIPTVNNATLTIQRNGTTVDTFTANASQDKSVNIVVPTLTSDLTNDSGFITDTDYASASTGGVVKVGAGLSITNGVLSVTGGGVADAVEWANVLNRPTNVSYWTNDAGYITSADLPTKTSDLTNDGSDGTSTYVEADDLATVATSGSYNDLTNKPTIPTVNDATITIQRNSTNVDSFTVNASQNKSINIVVPTNTNELTNGAGFITSSGTAAKANQLATARTIAISGGATGTATSFDGTSDISIPVTSVRDSYTVWGGKDIVGDISPDDAGCTDEFGHNKLAFLPASCIDVAYSTDGGTTWIDYGLTDTQKIALVTTAGQQIWAGKNTTASASNLANLRGRVRIACGTADKKMKLYTALKKILINFSTNGANDTKVKIRRRTIANYLSGTETWDDLGTHNVSGWPGWNSYPYSGTFGGNMTFQTGYWGQIEFEWWGESCASGATNAKCGLIDIRFIGTTNWATPSEMAKNGRLYTIDTAQNATFPANVNVTGSLGHGKYTYTLPDKNGTVAMTSDIPSVPTVNDGQLTIQKNGTNVQTFTANQSGNVTANITVPTKTSDLTNDGSDGASTYVEADDLATVATSGSYNDLSNKPTIPTVNNATLTIQKNSTNVATFTANASSNVTANISVPTATSDLTNDSGFITSITKITNAEIDAIMGVA